VHVVSGPFGWETWSDYLAAARVPRHYQSGRIPFRLCQSVCAALLLGGTPGWPTRARATILAPVFWSGMSGMPASHCDQATLAAQPLRGPIVLFYD